MKYIKKYENKSPKFEVGDVVVAINDFKSGPFKNKVFGGAIYEVLAVNETELWKIQIRQLNSYLEPISNSNFWGTWFNDNNFNLLYKHPFFQNKKVFNV